MARPLPLVKRGSVWRSSTATASTAFVVGATTPVRMLRVATSTAIVNPARRVTPSAYRHRMSMVLVVDLHMLPRPESDTRPEQAVRPVRSPPPRRRSPERVQATVHPGSQSIKVPLVGDRHVRAVFIPQRSPNLNEKGASGDRRRRGPAGHHRRQRGQHPTVNPGQRVRRGRLAQDATIDQAQQPLGVITPPGSAEVTVSRGQIGPGHTSAARACPGL